MAIMQELLVDEIFGEINEDNKPGVRRIAIMDNENYISFEGPTGRFIPHGISQRRKGKWYGYKGKRIDPWWESD